MTMRGVKERGPISGAVFSLNNRGLGLSSGKLRQVDDGEAVLISFDEDVLIESAAIVAGNGTCGGFYQVGDHAPLAVYRVDADIDAKDQSGLLSDIGVVEKGQTLRLDSSPHFGTESPGQWLLRSLTVSRLNKQASAESTKTLSRNVHAASFRVLSELIFSVLQEATMETKKFSGAGSCTGTMKIVYASQKPRAQ